MDTRQCECSPSGSAVPLSSTAAHLFSLHAVRSVVVAMRLVRLKEA